MMKIAVALTLTAAMAAAANSFVDELPADADMRLKTRHLLQDEDDQNEEAELETVDLSKELFGPSEFFTPGFYLKVDGAIVVNVYAADGNLTGRG